MNQRTTNLFSTCGDAPFDSSNPVEQDEDYDELDDDREAFNWQCPECCGENGKHAIDCPETNYGAFLRDGYD
jgi:hypothetical protein